MTNLTFCEAITHLKKGKTISRSKWNNKIMLIMLNSASVENISDPLIKVMAQNNIAKYPPSIHDNIRLISCHRKPRISKCVIETESILAQDWQVVPL